MRVILFFILLLVLQSSYAQTYDTINGGTIRSKTKSVDYLLKSKYYCKSNDTIYSYIFSLSGSIIPLLKYTKQNRLWVSFYSNNSIREIGKFGNLACNRRNFLGCIISIKRRSKLKEKRELWKYYSDKGQLIKEVYYNKNGPPSPVPISLPNQNKR
ncbi:MAG: hypothetical protein U9R42_01705 [Bacteroidota bacterium]|nr:hypothetical protein [Bacteroidota bacterium]